MPAASAMHSPTRRQTKPIASHAAQEMPPAAAKTLAGRRKIPVPMMPLMPSPTQSSRVMRRAGGTLLAAEETRVPVLRAGVALPVVVLEHRLQLAVVEEDAVTGVAAIGAHRLERELGHRS